MKNAMMRQRRCVILKPVNDRPTKGAVRKAWDDDEGFVIMTSDGPGKTIKRSEAKGEGIHEVAISFGVSQQLVLKVM